MATFGYIYSERKKRVTIVKIYNNNRMKEVERFKGTEDDAKDKCRELNSVIEKRIWNQTSFMAVLR